MICGIDAGGFNVKTCGPHGANCFISLIGEYRDLNIGQLGPNDMVVEYEGSKYFSGPIVETECELGGSRKGDTKAHFDAKLRVLIALHKAYGDDFSIVTGQPIKTHNDVEKQKIKNMLLGKHTTTINGVKKTFYIRNVEVAPEGAAAGLSDPQSGWVRYIDIGSGTVNYGTTKDLKYVDRDSFTESFGSETVMNKDVESFARRVCNRALEKWKETDHVKILGGDAKKFLKPIQEYFPDSTLLQPKLKLANGTVQTLDPIYGNAVSFYEISKRIY